MSWVVWREEEVTDDLVHSQGLAPVARANVWALVEGEVQVFLDLFGHAHQLLAWLLDGARGGALDEPIEMAELEQAAALDAHVIADAVGVALDPHAGLGDLWVLHDLSEGRGDEAVLFRVQGQVDEGDAGFGGELEERDVSPDALRLGGAYFPLEVEAEELFVHEILPKNPLGGVLAGAVVDFDLGARGAVLAGGAAVQVVGPKGLGRSLGSLPRCFKDVVWDLVREGLDGHGVSRGFRRLGRFLLDRDSFDSGSGSGLFRHSHDDCPCPNRSRVYDSGLLLAGLSHLNISHPRLELSDRGRGPVLVPRSQGRRAVIPHRRQLRVDDLCVVGEHETMAKMPCALLRFSRRGHFCRRASIVALADIQPPPSHVEKLTMSTPSLWTPRCC